MSTLVEIEEAIKKLPPAEAHQLWDWFLDYFEDELDVTEEFQREIEQGRREIASEARTLQPGAQLELVRLERAVPRG